MAPLQKIRKEETMRFKPGDYAFHKADQFLARRFLVASSGVMQHLDGTESEVLFLLHPDYITKYEDAIFYFTEKERDVIIKIKDSK